MKYGMYLAAAGALGSMYRQDVLSNNLANLNTVGFKPDSVVMQQTAPERIQSGAMTPPKLVLEQLGGVVQSAPSRPNLTQGEVRNSANPFDMAIEGDGFFTVGGGDDPADIRLTRDGRMTRDTTGQLVTITGGLPVLDDRGQPIMLAGQGDVTVDDQGFVSQGGQAVARIGLASPEQALDLKKVGANLFQLRDGAILSAERPAGRVRANSVEGSAVDPISTMTALMSAAKSANANIKMMQFHDYLTGQAVNVLGRI
ncbi:MAG: flagellar hook-basal body protein [Phycisphaerales bacterium]